MERWRVEILELQNLQNNPDHTNPITTTRYNERTSNHKKAKFFKTKTSLKSLRKWRRQMFIPNSPSILPTSAIVKLRPPIGFGETHHKEKTCATSCFH